MCINLVLGNYEWFKTEHEHLLDSLVFVLVLTSTLTSTLLFTDKACFFFGRTEQKEIAGTHMTMMATISNFCENIPKFYGFYAVERLGFELTNTIGLSYQLLILPVSWMLISKLQDYPISAFWRKEKA